MQATSLEMCPHANCMQRTESGARAGCTVLQVTVVNTVNTRLPFLPADENVEVSEEVRLRTRILDLR